MVVIMSHKIYFTFLEMFTQQPQCANIFLQTFLEVLAKCNFPS